MVSSKRERGVRATRYLSEEEKADYENYRYNLERQRSLQKLKALKSQQGYSVYRGTRTGKATSFISNIFGGRKQNPISTGVGRPRGSFDKRYAAYGGVYGYRRFLNTQLRIARMGAQRNAQLTPQQQMILQQAEANARAQRINPENQTIPRTSGFVPLAHLHKEADDAANIFP